MLKRKEIENQKSENGDSEDCIVFSRDSEDISSFSEKVGTKYDEETGMVYEFSDYTDSEEGGFLAPPNYPPLEKSRYTGSFDFRTEPSVQVKMAEGLYEEFPSVEEERISQVVHSLSNFVDDIDDKGNSLYEASKACIENSLTIEEVEFMEVIFKEGLRSATKDGISIIRMADGMEVRGVDRDKILDENEVQVIKSIVNSSSSPLEDYKPFGGVDISGNGGGGGGIFGNPVTISTTADDIEEEKMCESVARTIENA